MQESIRSFGKTASRQKSAAIFATDVIFQKNSQESPLKPILVRTRKKFAETIINSCRMLISAVHHENGEEKLRLLMVDSHIPAGAKSCIDRLRE